MTHKITSKLIFIIPVILGIMVIVMMKGNKKLPEKSTQKEMAYAVRTINVPELDIKPLAIGYGEVQPAQVWKAVAQVTGRIVEMHPQLRNGEIITKGSLLYRIDPVDYELNLAQAETELAELEVSEKNTRQSLLIEQKNLNLAERELKRLRGLAIKGNVSQSDVDNAERNVLNSSTPVQNLTNTLALIPLQKKLLQSKIKQAQRDLEETQVHAPFNLRIAKLGIEQQQFISKGQNMFEGDSIERVEITAQVAMSSLKNLFIDYPDDIPSPEKLAQNMAQYTSFKPIIKLDMGSHIAQWEAEFVRFTDVVDARTRTMGLVMAVDKPFSKVKPGIRPPLSKGMFVEVNIMGKTQNNKIIIPRNAIHKNKVMLVNKDNRLESRKIKVLYHQRDRSIIHSGLKSGEQLIVSDLIPAMEGMLLENNHDVSLQSQLEKYQPINNNIHGAQ